MDFRIQRDTFIAVSLAAMFSLLFAFTWSHTIWPDEWRSMAVAQGILEYGFPTLLDFNFYFHPPLFMYLIVFFQVLVNNFLLAGKLTVLLFAFGSVFLLYKLGRLFLDKFYSLVYTILSAGSFAFWWSANHVEHEIALIFFYLLVTLLVLKLNEKSERKQVVLLGFVLGLLLLTKASAMVLFFLTLVYAGWVLIEKNNFKTSVFKFAPLVAISLLMLLPLFGYRWINNAPLYVDPALVDLVISPSALSNKMFLFENLFYYVFHIFELIEPILLVFFFTGLLAVFLRKEFRKFAFLLAVIFISLAVTSFSAVKLARFLYPIVPLMVLISVCGLQFLLSRPKFNFSSNAQKLVAIIIISLVFLPSFFGMVTDKSDGLENWVVWDELKTLLEGNPVLIEGDHFMAGKVLADVPSVHFAGIDRLDRQTQLGFHYLLLPLRDYSRFPQNFQLIKSYMDCNCGLFKLANPVKLPVLVAIVDLNNNPISGAFAQIIMLNDSNYSPFQNNTEFTQKHSLKYVVQQVNVYEDSYYFGNNEYFRYIQLTFSNKNGLISFSPGYSSDTGTGVNGLHFKGFIAVSKLCYQPQSVPFVLVKKGNEFFIATCSDSSMSNCQVLKEIKLHSAPCWLNKQPSFS